MILHLVENLDNFGPKYGKNDPTWKSLSLIARMLLLQRRPWKAYIASKERFEMLMGYAAGLEMFLRMVENWYDFLPKYGKKDPTSKSLSLIARMVLTQRRPWKDAIASKERFEMLMGYAAGLETILRLVENLDKFWPKYGKNGPTWKSLSLIARMLLLQRRPWKDAIASKERFEMLIGYAAGLETILRLVENLVQFLTKIWKKMTHLGNHFH